MSEQIKQDANSQSPEIEDDPLAELARIVAGEPELNPPPQEQPPLAVEPQLADESSIEVALEEQLMAEFSMDDAPVVDVETPAFVEDINTSIDQINTEEFSSVEAQPEPLFYEAPVEPVVEETYQPEVPVQAPIAEPEVGFQDGLINALEMEIVGQPEPEQIAEPVPVEIAAQQSVSQGEEHATNTQETLEQELAAQFEPAQPAYEEPIASIEGDLGAAFANEFEQMSEQQAEPVLQETVFETPITAEPVQQEVVQGDPNLEVDFEAAFAQELEGAAVPETQGWTETETVEANAAFTEAVAPTHAQAETNLDAMEYDPGHVGSVDDITAVEAGAAVAANDNGGGKKYAVAALVIALFAGAIAAGYGFLGGENSTIASGTPEIIKADVEPVKVKPKDPGGLVPENQDNASYGDLGGENNITVSQETLTSQTEEPIVLNTGNTAEIPKSDDRLTASDDIVAATPSANASSVVPKVVQTVVVKPDGTIITKPATPKPVETALNTVTIGDTSNVVVKPVSTQVIKKPEAIDGAKTTGVITIPVASPLPKPIIKPKPAPVKKVVAAAPKPKKVAPPPVRKSEWVVQVSSQRTPEAAQSSFSSMRNRYSVLQGRAMAIQRANVNGTTYYRVRVQTASRADANQLCTSIASAGGGCFVTK